MQSGKCFASYGVGLGDIIGLGAGVAVCIGSGFGFGVGDIGDSIGLGSTVGLSIGLGSAVGLIDGSSFGDFRTFGVGVAAGSIAELCGEYVAATIPDNRNIIVPDAKTTFLNINTP